MRLLILAARKSSAGCQLGITTLVCQIMRYVSRWLTWIGIRAAREPPHEMFGSFARKRDTGRKQTVAAQAAHIQETN